MPFPPLPGSHKSWAKRLSSRSLSLSTVSPLALTRPTHVRAKSVSPTAEIRAYPSTPLLDETFDTTPFSESFSALLRFSPYKDDTFMVDQPARTSKGLFARSIKGPPALRDASYVVEAVSNIRDVDSEWDDDDVEEVMVISSKTKTSPIAFPPLHLSPESLFISPSLTDTPISQLASPATSAYTVVCTLKQAPERISFLAESPQSGDLIVVRVWRLPAAQMARAEYDTMRKVADAVPEGNSPYLERMIYAWEDERLGAAYLVTPYHAGGNLLQYMQETGVVEGSLLRTWAAEIACGLMSLQDSGIVHGAVRPSAVLIHATGHVVLSGFERSAHLVNCNAMPDIVDKDINAEWYHAPELLLGWRVGLEVDWWGYGIVLAWMACGQHPFFLSPGENVRGEIMRKRILAGTASSVALDVLDASMRGLIEECLERNPAKRTSFIGVCEHPVFADLDWSTLMNMPGSDLKISLPRPIYSATPIGDRPVVLIPLVRPKCSQPLCIAPPPSPDQDPGHRHKRNLSHATTASASTLGSAVLTRATRTRLPAARPMSITLSPQAQSPPLTPLLTPPDDLEMLSRPSFGSLALTCSPSDAGSPCIASPALSSNIGSPMFTSSPACVRPANPCPTSPTLDFSPGNTSALTIRPAPAGLGLSDVDLDGTHCVGVDEFGLLTSGPPASPVAQTPISFVNALTLPVPVPVPVPTPVLVSDTGSPLLAGAQAANDFSDGASLRARVRSKLRKRRREASVVSPAKPRTTEGADGVADLAGVEIAVPDFDTDVGEDPFRISGSSVLPHAQFVPLPPSPEEPVFNVRKPTPSFRWSTLSLDAPELVPATAADDGEGRNRSVGRRIKNGSQALLRKSQSSLKRRLSRAPSFSAPVGTVVKMGQGIGFTRAAAGASIGAYVHASPLPQREHDEDAAQGCLFLGKRRTERRPAPRRAVTVESARTSESGVLVLATAEGAVEPAVAVLSAL